MKEIWKPVKDWADYEISNMGRLRSYKQNKNEPKILKTFINKEGYERVQFYDLIEKKRINKYIHRLVMEAFEPIDIKMEINHIDGNKSNNKLDNLEWSDRSANMKHAVKTGIIVMEKGEKAIAAKFTQDEAEYIRKIYIPYNKECGQTALARQYGVTVRTIRAIVNNERYVS